jgi:translation elongation factor EF-Tu-like GTPase
MRYIIAVLLLFFFTNALAQRRPPRRTPPAPPPPVAEVNLPDSAFYMPIEDVFNVPGKGVAVTGKISTGKITVGKRINIMGFSGVALVVTVTAINKAGAGVPQAVAGDLVGLIFSTGVTQEQVMRGMVAIDGNFGKLDVLAVATLTLSTNAGVTYRDGDLISLYYNLKVIPLCELVLPPGQELRPGVPLQVKISFPVYVVMIPNLEFAIWNSSTNRAIGKGTLIVAADE